MSPATQNDGIELRFATPADSALILDFIHKLAQYERLSHEVEASEEQLREGLSGEQPAAEAVLAFDAGVPAGYALFYRSFSSFLARPGIHIEDLFVEPQFRGKGVAKSLFGFIARIAVERDCGRLEWAVLDWDDPAVRLYRNSGAESLSELTVFRLSGPALERIAARSAR